MLGFGGLAKRLLGSENDRKLKAARAQVERINGLEPQMEGLSDEELAALTPAFRERLAAGEKLDALLPEAFAAVREAARRSIGLRHFDVQLVGGAILHAGKIAEMKTGEGKTLVATLPVYLNALAEKGVHVVTVNDYLARRDAEWMGQVYRFLGLSVGVIVPGMNDVERRAAYDSDVTYATNNELGFDYLRDNMKYSLASMTQRGRYAYAIVDEVDSILIDEARTPLIISGPTEEKTELYTTIDAVIPKLEADHFEIDEKQRTVVLTEDGTEFVEQQLREMGLVKGDATLYDPQNVSLVHHTNQALRAHKLFTRDKDYITMKGEVVIIDEHTGRMMQGRRYSDGLHQALEAKERVKIMPENVTMASVTFQNYFRMYDKLAGMTGTALTEAAEFGEIYGLDVVEVPTNVPVLREDEDDQVFRSGSEKEAAILEAIKDGVERGQPMLVGTTSIEKSERLAELLTKEKIEHQVLNARHHAREAMIVAQAGRPGAVTIATNMAGRGTDIQLGGNVDMLLAQRVAEEGLDPTQLADPAVAAKLEALRETVAAAVAEGKKVALEAGGLWVIATERHESRRIDNQLRGRSGRQGDPGRSTFYLSLQDDLMRIFGSDRMDGMLRRLGLQEGEAIVHPWVNKAIERSQAKVEARNFEIRKNLLKYDDVMNDQRRAIFEQRLEIMQSEDVADEIKEMRHSVIESLVSEHIPERAYAEQWDTDGLQERVNTIFGAPIPVKDWAAEEGVDDETIRERLEEEGDKLSAKKTVEIGADNMRAIEKQVLLHTIDHHWREHLATLDHLRSVIGFRGYAQRDPLNEYKTEAFQLFEGLLAQLRTDVVGQLMNVRLAPPEPQRPAQLTATSISVTLGDDEPIPITDDPFAEEEAVAAAPEPAEAAAPAGGAQPAAATAAAPAQAQAAKPKGGGPRGGKGRGGKGRRGKGRR